MKKCYANVFLYPFVLFPIFRTLFWLLCFDCSSKSKISWQKIHFLLFSFSCFYSHVSFPFLSLLVFLSRGSDSRGQNTSPREMSGSNQGECLGWWFLARFGSNGVFLVIEWLVCDTDSPRYTRKWMLIIISLCPLSPLLLSLCLPSFLSTWQSHWKHWATWGGEAEARRFDGLCRRSKEEDRARKTKSCGKTTQWHGRRNKQTGR